MVCSIVQTQKQFLTSGCPNCEEILQLAGSLDAVTELTSQLFEGTLTLANPASSWVGKWLRLGEYVPGVYAIKVNGTLPEEIIDALSDRGIRYVPRDGSDLTDEVA